MENNQTEYIRKNLTTLLNRMRCTSPLLAGLVGRDILSFQDQEDINSKKNNFSQCYRLIQILFQRTNAYDGLLLELQATNQTGAVDILKQINRPDDILASERKISSGDTQTKMELLVDQHSEIFTKGLASEETIREILAAFYDKEMESFKKYNTSSSQNILSEYHKQISNSMVEGFVKITENGPMYRRTNEILNQLLTENNNKYVLCLDGNNDDTPAIGIDLGTCNCCTAVYMEGKVTVFSNEIGDKYTPSYVFFNENGSEMVGKTAKTFAYRNPDFTVYDSKRILGRSFADPELQNDRKLWQFKVIDDKGQPKIVTRNEVFTPAEISAKLLVDCRKQAENHLKMTVTKAVITVPAYFNDSQLRATKEAADLAEIEILQLLKEPTAAAITYRQERFHKNTKTVLIFDMGGGTFDVAVAKIGDSIDILGIDGDTHLGGQDFDQCIVKHCIEKFQKERPDNYQHWSRENVIKRNMSNLLLACENGKKELSYSESTEILVDLASDYSVILTRDTFATIASHIHLKVTFLVKRLLESTQMIPCEIEDVILVGGSSRNIRIKEFLGQYFDWEKINPVVHEDHAVAYGAAIQASRLHGERSCKLLSLENIKDVIPMSFGVQVVKDGVVSSYSRIIKKNSTYPNAYQHTYLTHKENQESAVIRVYQGENDIVTDNFYLGSFRIEGIPRAPRGKESIIVCMEIDNMGILQVSAYSNGNKGKGILTVKLVRGLGVRSKSRSESV